MYILTVAMQKGGVAKTTTAAVLAQAGQYKGKRVLALDLDPQANLSFALGADARKPGTFELIAGTIPAADLIQHCGGVDVIPAGNNLIALTTSKGSALRLRRNLQSIAGNYDFVFIDTPTREGEQLYNALCASNGLLIPSEADIYNLQSIYQICDTAKAMQRANTDLHILGYIVTKAESRSIISRQMQEKLQAVGVPCLGMIRQGVAIKEAAALQRNLYEYEPKSNPAADYLALFERIEQHAGE